MITIPAFSTGYSWTHLAITWSGTYATTYLNGQEVRESPVTGTPDWTSKPLFIGANYQAGEYFGGAIDEIRVWVRKSKTVYTLASLFNY